MKMCPFVWTRFFLRTTVLCAFASNVLGAGGPGDALRFAAGGFVSVTHNEALNAYPFTVTAWFRTTQLAQAGLITKGPPAGIGWQVFLNNDNLFVAYDAGGGSVGTAADPLIATGGIANDTWHHVAFAVDANGGRLYVDGVLRDTRSWTGTPGATTAPYAMVFGDHSGGANLFDGWLDEVTVWNVALSQAQVQANMGRILDGDEPGLVAYYRCAAGGVTVNDSAPAAGTNDGNINGSVAFVPSGVNPFLPYIETLAATSSNFNGVVNPFGTNTTAWFEWGPTTNYGNTTTSTGFGPFVANFGFSQSVTSQFGTYHCRAVASNSYGAVFGADQSFSVPLVTTRCFDFDDGQLPTNTALYGNATLSMTGEGVKLTENLTIQTGSFIVEDFNYGANVTAIEVQFALRIGGGLSCHGDGVSFVWAKDLPSLAFGEERDGGLATWTNGTLIVTNGLVVSFDTYQNDPVTDPAPALDLLYGGTFTNRIPTPININSGIFPVRIKVSANGLLDLYYVYEFADYAVTNVPLPGFTGLAGARFGWGARTGGCTDNHWVDDICVTTQTFCPMPTIRIDRSGTNVAVTFIGLLQTAPSLAGPWTTISNAPNPYVISATGEKFFRASLLCIAP